MGKIMRGFALMSKARLNEVAAKGGRTAAAIPGHMSAIGKLGGAKVSADREHMSRLGKVGGAVSRRNRLAKKETPS